MTGRLGFDDIEGGCSFLETAIATNRSSICQIGAIFVATGVEIPSA